MLPPAEDVFGGQPPRYTTGLIEPGTATQTVTDIPDGSYVIWASCGYGTTPNTLWISDYPGIADYLARFPQNTVFPAPREATIVTVPSPESSGSLADIGAIFGS